jgi:glutathione S-transferase
MTEIKVHSIPGSPYGRAVLIAPEEKRAPYRLVAVPPKSLRSPEHLARHPFGRIPVLEHGHFRLYETQASLRYIDRTLPGPLLAPLLHASSAKATTSGATRRVSPTS